MKPNSLEKKEEAATHAIDDLIEAYKNEIAALKENIEEAYHEAWFDRHNDPDTIFEDAWHNSKARKDSK